MLMKIFNKQAPNGIYFHKTQFLEFFPQKIILKLQNQEIVSQQIFIILQ